MNKQMSNRNSGTKKPSRVENLKKNKKGNSIICAIVVVFVLGIIIDHFNFKKFNMQFMRESRYTEHFLLEYIAQVE